MAARLPKAFVSWSSGKDSAYALLEARRQSIAEIVGIITTINTTDDRVAVHGVREGLLTRQAAALGLPLVRVELPYPCPNEVYEARFLDACVSIKAQGVEHIVFGDLFLEDIRTYREGLLARAGMQGVFPLWRRDTHSLAHEMIASGIVAHLVCVDLGRLDPSYAGRPFDSAFLSHLPYGIDPCGENGEFHTVVSAGPMFAAPIPVHVGETVERDRFVYADVIPN
jgi:uncharacterized protein (TIGR00290 family)